MFVRFNTSKIIQKVHISPNFLTLIPLFSNFPTSNSSISQSLTTKFEHSTEELQTQNFQDFTRILFGLPSNKGE